MTDDQWDALWAAFHGHSTETLRAPLDAVEALDPHIVSTPPRPNSKTVVVTRAQAALSRIAYNQGHTWPHLIGRMHQCATAP